MKILHISQNSNGIEEVTLLANRIDKNNSLHAIEKNDEVFYTGGFIFNNTLAIKEIFENIPKEKQYEFAISLKSEPFVKSYFL